MARIVALASSVVIHELPALPVLAYSVRLVALKDQAERPRS
jgi:hypothetical protein